MTEWEKINFQASPLLAPIAAGARIAREKVESGLDRAANDERNFSKMHPRCTFDRIAKGLRETYSPSRRINWNFHFNITTAVVRGECACVCTCGDV